MKKRISIFLGIFLLILISLTLKSYAGYSSNDPVVISGGETSITISSSETLQNYDLKLTSYTGLTYVGCSKTNEAGAIVEVNTTTGAISYISTGDGTKTLGTYTFKVPDVTEKTTYKVIFNVNDTTNISYVTVNPKENEKPSTDNEGNNTSTPNTPSTPSTPATTTKSNNANVKMIETSPVDFTGFKSSKTSGYEVNVENDVDKITVNVTKEDSKATVSLLNKTNSDTGKSWVYIAEGSNEIEVTVTAEDGTTKKTYLINVIRKEKEEVKEPEQPIEEEPEVEQPVEEIFGLSELKIEGYEIEPKFQTDIYEYKINLNDNVEKLKITTLATEVNSTVEILGNDYLNEGENIITINVKKESEEKMATYQIIVNKTTPIENNQNTVNIEVDHQQMFKKIIILSIAVMVIVLIIIITIVVKVRQSKEKNNSYIPYENVLNGYDEEEYNQYNDEQPEKKTKRSKGKRFK